MSHKSERVTALLDAAKKSQAEGLDPHYTGFFECFNRREFFEAHEVLEDLWLVTDGPLHGFYKGLIQLAGAFVHLSKSKSDPAARLFRLSAKHLAPHAPVTERLDVDALLARIQGWLSVLEDSRFTRNPYDPAHPPRVELMRATRAGKVSK